MIEVTLECEHKIAFRQYPPKRAERIWCVKCEDMKSVKQAPPEFNVKCKSCSVSKNYGRDKDKAEHAATAHRNNRPTHVVQVRDGLEVLATYGPPEDTLEASQRLTARQSALEILASKGLTHPDIRA